jgi:hypothetical protein
VHRHRNSSVITWQGAAHSGHGVRINIWGLLLLVLLVLLLLLLLKRTLLLLIRILLLPERILLLLERARSLMLLEGILSLLERVWSLPLLAVMFLGCLWFLVDFLLAFCFFFGIFGSPRREPS